MKILILSPRFPYPLEKGDKLRLFHQLRLLKYRHQICLVCFNSEEIENRYMNIIEDLTSECHVLKIPKNKRLISAFKALVTGGSLQTAYYYNTKAQKKINRIIQKFQPQHIYCQLTRVGPYVENIDIPKTIDYMDAFGVGMERRASITKGLYRLLYGLESRRMKKYESNIYHQFDNHTIISEQDRMQIADGKLDITINPNGIDTSFFTPFDREKDHDIGFVGNMGYPPNVDAAEYLINTLKLGNNFKVLLAGARPDRRVKLLAQKNVTITGWVDDVRGEYARCHIFVAPLWSGTGQQNKILEAMAMGIPCITTSVVNNAINGQHEIELLIADTEEEFIQSIDRLLNDTELYNTLRINGLQLVKNNYSWEHNVDILESIFKK